MDGVTYLDVLSETRRVVITGSLRITECFEYRIGCKNLALYFARLIKRDFGLGLSLDFGRIHRSKVTHDVFGLEGYEYRASEQQT